MPQQLHDKSIDPMIDLNSNCYDLIKQKNFPDKTAIFLENLEDPSKVKEKVVVSFFKHLLSTHSSSVTKTRKKRQLTMETLNRYLFTLNKIYEHEVFSQHQLMTAIQTDLESQYHEKIDKKTLKKILDLLEGESLIKIHKYRVTYDDENESSEDEKTGGNWVQMKYILSTIDIEADDERISSHPAVNFTWPRPAF